MRKCFVDLFRAWIENLKRHRKEANTLIANREVVELAIYSSEVGDSPPFEA